MSLFYQYQSRFLEGLAMLQKCAELLENQPASQQRDLSLASLQCDISWLLIPLGELDGAEKSALASYTFVQQYRMLPSEAQGFHPLLPLGIIASIRGDYKTAIRHAETVRQESETQSPPWNQQLAYYLLTTTSRHLGDIHAAQKYAQKTYDLAERNQDHWFMGYCLNELGNVASDKGDSPAARGYYQASYNLRRAIDDPGGMAAALTNLGKIELLDSDFPQAKEHFQTAEEIYQEVNDRGGLATSIFGIAQVAAAQGDFQTAEPLLKQALEIAISIPYYSQCTAILGYIGQLLFGSGETQVAAEILNLVLNHPASERNTKDQAHQLLSTVMWSHPKDELDINEVIMGLLAQFPSLDVAGFAHAVRSSQAQDLIDPLTGRELEVLGLIENGLTNHQIGEKLFISPGTAKWYASQIYRKLGVKNRTQAVARARKLNLIGK